MKSKQLVWSVVLSALLAANATAALGQISASDPDAEQTVFNAEPDLSGKMDVRRPAEIPDSALDVLRDTIAGGDLNCLKSKGTTLEQVPASWFVASAIHLNGPNEIDLVVLLNESITDPMSPAGCLFPAHGNKFWVLGPGHASGRYGLLLATYGFRLDVLGSQTNRYRDIEVSSEKTALIYRYTVSQYQLAEQRTAP